jgi:PAS domain S-box-containing protein
VRDGGIHNHMDMRSRQINTTNLAPIANLNDVRVEQRTGDLSTRQHRPSQTPSGESVIQPADDADGMFTHAPVSLWEEDFSEVKRRFDQLKRNGVDDLRKHLKKHPEEVLSLARMVRIVRVNKETLALYDAAGPIEFREGLSPIFNKGSFEVFKDELMAFWKGKTSFNSEAINLTLTGTSKNLLIHVIIPPGFEQTWAKVYIAITDITAIRDSIRNLAASEQKYRSVFDAVQTAVLLADVPSGMIVEANKSAKRLLGASSSELVGMHLADLMQGEEQDSVRALLRLHLNQPSPAGQVIHVRHKSNGTIPVLATANTIVIGDANVIVVSLTPPDELAPIRSTERKVSAFRTGLGKKLTQREREILSLICSGKSSRAIAHQLCISEKTVETHRTRIMQKLDTHCVVDLVKFAMINRLARLQ